MSHEITEIDTQEGRVQAWHGLTVVREDLSLDNCILNKWDIESTRLLVPSGKMTIQNEIEIPEMVATPFSILKANDIQTVIGTPYAPESYKPITNKSFLAMAKESLKDVEGVNLESAGSIMARGRVFLSFALPDIFRAAGRDFKAFLNFGNGHDRSSILWANTSNICTVCNNTFSANMAEMGKAMGLKLKHTKHSSLKLENGIRTDYNKYGVWTFC